jgi:hypothetical protein
MGNPRYHGGGSHRTMFLAESLIHFTRQDQAPATKGTRGQFTVPVSPLDSLPRPSRLADGSSKIPHAGTPPVPRVYRPLALDNGCQLRPAHSNRVLFNK